MDELKSWLKSYWAKILSISLPLSLLSYCFFGIRTLFLLYLLFSFVVIALWYYVASTYRQFKWLQYLCYIPGPLGYFLFSCMVYDDIDHLADNFEQYEEIKKNPNESDCRKFLYKFKENGFFYEDVLDTLYHIKEKSSPKELDVLLNFCENGNPVKMYEKISSRVHVMCDSLYSIALINNTEEDWYAYAEMVPVSEVRDYKERIEQIWSTDYSAWNQVVYTNTLSAYEKYLSLYPRGKHKKEAEKIVIDAKVDDIYANAQGSLPPMDVVSYDGTLDSHIYIHNGTAYPLHVLYSGLISKEVVIQSNKNSKVKLRNGKYKVAAYVDNKSVRGYAGDEVLTGCSYSVSYYIKTDYYKGNTPINIKIN